LNEAVSPGRRECGKKKTVTFKDQEERRDHTPPTLVHIPYQYKGTSSSSLDGHIAH
jgi:hypothetical protein